MEGRTVEAGLVRTKLEMVRRVEEIRVGDWWKVAVNQSSGWQSMKNLTCSVT